MLSFLTAAAMLGGVAVPAELGTVLTAQAYTDDTSDGLDSDSVTNPLRVPVDEASMVLEMTSVSLTLEELKAADYTVPVYVQFSRSEAIDAMQFGIMADERTEITVVNDPVESITSGYDIVRGGMAVNESSEVPGMYRFAWAASENKEISQPLVLLLVKLPEDAVEGDQFDISFLDREDTYPTFFRTLTDEGRVRLPFALVDGSIEICESDDPTEPETAEPETTEPETTEPETTEPDTPGSDVVNPLHVSVDEASVVLEMPSISLTLEELKAGNYTVPICIELSRYEPMDYMEFGILADERVTTTFTGDQHVAGSYGYTVEHTVSSQSNINPNMYWVVWASNGNQETFNSLGLLLVTLPEDAAEGDQFDISFLDKGVVTSLGAPAMAFFETKTDDQGAVNLPFALVDGSIEICGAEESTEPETTEPTEPETTDPNPTEPAEPPLGDVSGDNVINAGDAAVTLSAAAAYGATGKYGNLTDAQIAAADIDGSGMVNASDAAYILQYAAMRGANGKDFDIRELVK